MFERDKFAKRLLLLRKRNGASQETLASLLGITRTQISDMENGKAGTSLERLVALSEYFGVTTDYLLGLSDRPRG